ncbi:MAG: hypothetical protein ACJ8GN_13990 [Longimicrobiaceae bacterium]
MHATSPSGRPLRRPLRLAPLLLESLARARVLRRAPELPALAAPGAETIARALGVDMQAARALAARAARHQREVLLDPRRAGPAAALRRLRRETAAGALPAPAPDARATVLALPLTRAAVALVAGVARSGRTLRVLRTVASEACLRPFLPADGDARLCTAAELLAHARAARSGGATYVTFPEHYLAGGGASRRVSFLGGEHLFSILEAVLLARGARLLAADVEEGARAPRLRECPVGLASGTLAAGELDAVVGWVAGCAQRVIAADPAELLTWGAVERHSAEAVLRARVVSLGSLQGFLRAWKAEGAGLPDEVYGWSVAELERLRAAARAGQGGAA